MKRKRDFTTFKKEFDDVVDAADNKMMNSI